MLKWVHYSPLPKNHTTVTSPLKKDEKDRSTNERENEKVYSNRLSRSTKSQTTEENEILECTVKYLGGSDPRVATCRGKLQNKRSKLNQEINKELRLRAGAENLFKATTNRKLKETVALELSFVNSNLQLLKEQLAELNSSVELYQNVDGEDPVMPMIPLGLKETKDIDFRDPFKVSI
ncbi:hypothetical protein HZH68_007418 [Vespula germanica]|uniref:REM-1 domain-containing protein n=3 Tax=Vespula TaxID=7451 RepID=A0A834NBR2_VESGE|nr:hypothetical protein HZH66_006677 [Vespula vulgaris]KAF7401598.1 hypothetical protein HZH68_007418 [Vespula germanica]KAF7425524.1 hypothetical protein H0235_007962 [Vespula pensylvanica]